MSSTIILPDLLSAFPAPHALNLHYELVAAESVRWMESFHVLNPKAQAVFNTHDFSLVASRFYPYVNREHLRLACDICNWFFAYDAVSDDGHGDSVKEIADTLIKLLENPSAALPVLSPLAEMTKSFWSRTIEFATPSASQRLGESLRRYVASVGVEAQDREEGFVRSVEDYLVLRRDTSAIKCTADFILLPHNISEDVMTHPCIQKLTEKTRDICIFVNDILSYNFERRHGQDGHNIVTAIMKEKSLDVQAALDYTTDLCHQTMRSLLEDVKLVPSFTPSIDKIIQEYIIGLSTLVTGLHDWSFESKRYFGNEGAKVKCTRVVQLYQPEQNAEVLRKDGRYTVVGTLRALEVIEDE